VADVVVVFGGLISTTVLDTSLTQLLIRRLGETALARVSALGAENRPANAM
jgi:hypothetical protein